MGKTLLSLFAVLALAGCGQESPAAPDAPVRQATGAGTADPKSEDVAADAATDSPRAAAGVRTPTGGPAQPARLTAAERTYLRDGAISTEAVGQAFRERDWDEVVRGFADAAAADPDAQELTRVYRDWLSGLAAAEGLRLADLSCGLSLCAGAFRGTGASATAQYERLRERLLHSAREYPMHVYMDSSRGSAATHIDFRFFFSMDEDVAAATQAAY